MLRIRLTSVLVDDQDKALAFYTEKLGFVKKTEIPLGEHRWLTVVAPDEQAGPEIVLEPAGLPEARTYREALVRLGIPYTAFQVDDIQHVYNTLVEREVKFTMKPTNAGAVTIAVLDDTCGNLIQLFQVN